MKCSLVRENCHAMAKIIYDPDQKPVAVADVKELIKNTIPKFFSLFEKVSEIRRLLNVPKWERYYPPFSFV